MTTVSATVARALRLLRVIDAEDGVPESYQYIICQEALNAMMARWEAYGISLGWAPVSSPDDVLPVPIEAEAAIAYNLAVAVQPEFGAALEPSVLRMAERGYSDVTRDILASSHDRLSYDLPCAESDGYYSASDFYSGR